MKPTTIRLISYAEIMRLLEPCQVIDALAEGFKALTEGRVQAPPRPKIEIPGGGFSLAMLAWMPGLHITLKAVSVFHHNADKGLESHQALISLFDAATGVPLAVLDGAAITGLRTAAAAILSVRVAARHDARIATVIGTGVQGRDHLRLLPLARNFDEIRVYGRRHEAAERMVAGVAAARAVADLETAVRGADVVCLTTSSATPVIDAGWVKAGAHVTSVGFAPPGSELPSELISRCRVLVEAKTAFQPAPVGCAELAGRDPSIAAELGEVLLGRASGRSSREEITLYKSMGNGMEDLVVANLAYNAAVTAGPGRVASI